MIAEILTLLLLDRCISTVGRRMCATSWCQQKKKQALTILTRARTQRLRSGDTCFGCAGAFLFVFSEATAGFSPKPPAFVHLSVPPSPSKFLCPSLLSPHLSFFPFSLCSPFLCFSLPLIFSRAFYNPSPQPRGIPRG